MSSMSVPIILSAHCSPRPSQCPNKVKAYKSTKFVLLNTTNRPAVPHSLNGSISRLAHYFEKSCLPTLASLRSLTHTQTHCDLASAH